MQLIRGAIGKADHLRMPCPVQECIKGQIAAQLCGTGPLVCLIMHKAVSRVIGPGGFAGTVIELDRDCADGLRDKPHRAGHGGNAHCVAGADGYARRGGERSEQCQSVCVCQGQRLLIGTEPKRVFDLLKGHVIRCKL